MRRWSGLLLASALWLASPPLLDAQQPTPQMDHMHMGDSTAMAMPVPMPAGMKMMPGLVGLVPPGETFLPGAGKELSALPEAVAAKVTPLKNGDTLELTVNIDVSNAADGPHLPLDAQAIADGLAAWASQGIGHLQIGMPLTTPATVDVVLDGIGRFRD